MFASARLRPAQLAMFALLSLACAKGPPSGGAGTYRGVATNVKAIGVLEVTVSESGQGPLPATGTLRFPNKSLELTGTLDKSKTELSLSSSDGYKLIGTSRPTHVYGSYTDATGTDMGAFGLLLQASGSSVELFCGSLLDKSETTTKGVTLPLGITARPGADAVCVGPNFTWLGGLGNNGFLGCASAENAVIEGKVSDSGNPWGTGEHYGTWSVAPCASNGLGGDGGVSDGDGGIADGPDAADPADAADPGDAGTSD